MSERWVAILTGAGRGMGAACARELAARGYSVSLMSRSAEASELAKELDGLGTRGSVTEESDLRSLVDATLQRFARIDAVVNSTGDPASGDLLGLTDDEWHEGLDLVFMNVVRMARLVTPVMLRQGGGAIVNFSTCFAYEPSPRFPISSSFRAALGGFTKLYADRYAEAGIRMNNILPGFIDSYEVDDGTRRSIPMQRAGTVGEIAKTVAFLVSPEARYITGQNLRVDGGLTRSI
jgi:NAD(P)-dependent dehydrogenase (short-subunit alcohol dehydrogenase family)